MALYTCFTDCGKWSIRLAALLCKEFEAYNDKDAIRLALYYCWQDGEEFFASKAPEAVTSKSKDTKASSLTPSASAKSTNTTSQPLISKPKTALHPTNLAFVPCNYYFATQAIA